MADGAAAAPDRAVPTLGPGQRLGSLDGVRAFAVGAVVLLHSGTGLGPGGGLGVDVFLVLSGYLITTLLHGELRAHGRIDVPRFYVRRALRLYPAMLAMVAVVVLVTVLLDRSQTGPALTSAAVVVLYLSDAVVGWGVGGIYGPFFHTWSLAVEEHFYLLWPLVLGVLVRRSSATAALGWAVGTVVLLAGWTTALGASGASFDRLAYSFDTRSTGLAVGCAVALALEHPVARHRVLRFGRIAAAPAGGVLCLLVLTGTSERFLASGGFLALALLSACVLLGCLQPGRLSTVLSWSPLRQLGLRSYGIYVWHFPVFLLLSADRLGLAGSPLALGAVKLVVLAVLVELSYRVVERGPNQLRHRFAPRPVAPPPAGPPPARARPGRDGAP